MSAARAEGQLAAAEVRIEQLRQDQEAAAARLASATLSAAPATQPITSTLTATQPAATTQAARN